MTKYITAAVLFLILLTFSAAGLAVSVINPGLEFRSGYKGEIYSGGN